MSLLTDDEKQRFRDLCDEILFSKPKTQGILIVFDDTKASYTAFGDIEDIADTLRGWLANFASKVN